jgi:putative intracellular protease/amidase
MAKILFIVSGATYWVLKDGTRYATGYWAEEFANPYKILTDAGHEVVVATPNGVTPNVDMMSLRPSMAGGEQGALELEAIIRSAEVMRRPLKLSDVRLEDYDAVYLPGGHGPMADLAFDADVGRLLTAQLASGNPLFIVCHAPAAMLATRIHGVSPFKGYRMTCFTDEEEAAVGVAAKAPWLPGDGAQGKDRRRLQPRGDLEAVHGRGPESGHRAEPGVGGGAGEAAAGGARRGAGLREHASRLWRSDDGPLGSA